MDTLRQRDAVDDERVVTQELNLPSKPLREELPAVPIVLGHSVFDADDRVQVNPFLIQVDQLQRGQSQALAGELVAPVPEQRAGSRRQRESDLIAGLVARLTNPSSA